MADKLHKLRKELVERCNIELVKGLLDDLQQENILSDAEVESIDEGNRLCSDKCRTLVDTVRKKGDYSSNILIQKLSERDQMLSKTLQIIAPAELTLPTQEQKIVQPSPTAPAELTLPTQEQKIVQPSPTAPAELTLPTQEQKIVQPSPTEVDGITLCSENEFQEITTKEKEIYPIRHKCNRKRLALIICNDKFDHLKERKGAEFDLDGMKILLEGLQYNVHWKTNLTTREMRNTMKAFAAENDHKDSDSTFLVFTSHGERDVICGTDSKIIQNDRGQDKMTSALHVDEIFNIFNNVNCSGLRDKPKVIIIQACRGNEKSQVLVSDCAQATPSVQPEELEDDAMCMIQKERDFICFCSTTPDTVSWRNPKKGSLFILRLIEYIKKDAHCSSLEDIFRKVQNYFKDNVQMPTQERKTLMKKIFLFPGY